MFILCGRFIWYFLQYNVFCVWFLVLIHIGSRFHYHMEPFFCFLLALGSPCLFRGIITASTTGVFFYQQRRVLFITVQSDCGDQFSLLSIGTGNLFPVWKRSEREANYHLSPMPKLKSCCYACCFVHQRSSWYNRPQVCHTSLVMNCLLIFVCGQLVCPI